MDMKKMLTLGGIAFLVAALALPAFARGPGWGGGPGRWGGGPGYDCPNYYGPSGANLTDEQRNKLTELGRNFYDSTAQLRNQIWTKRSELRTLMSSPNIEQEKARALQKEISDLQAKMAQERLNFAVEERKINPDARFGGGYGGGYGRGMGPGPGMGYGRHMGGGYGPRGCWN
jgi:Spy/CpxP family protein refolding chaperone